jgi:hypothetical protein
MVRRPSQTPSEFAAAVSRRNPAAGAMVAEITRAFESVRYGGNMLTPEDEIRLKAALEKIAAAVGDARGETAERS